MGGEEEEEEEAMFTYRVFFGGEMGQVAVVEKFCVFPVAADEVCFVCGRHVDVWMSFFSGTVEMVLV